MLDGTPHEYKEKPSGCADCGNSPVNHFEAYCMQALAIWSSSINEKGTRRPIRAFVSRWGDTLLDAAGPFFARAASHLPGISFTHDPEKAASYRSQVVWEEAVRRHIPMEQLTLFGFHTDIYRAYIRNMWVYFESLPVPDEYAKERYDWVDDKFLLKRALAAVGIPVPESHTATSLEEARTAFGSIGAAVVVKPRIGSRGRHTTVNVQTREQLESAFESAKQIGPHVTVETYLSGSVCRGTVVAGKLVGFFQADPPRITGDGASTINDLIRKQNEEKPERVQDIVLTPEHVRFIERMGYTPGSVLEDGTVISLTHRTGRLFGGRTRELLGFEHPKLRSYLEKAATTVKAPVIGFDLIIEDPEMDPDAQQWGIIEANSLPFIDLHYLPLVGTPSNVASTIWDLWNAAQRT